jgi:TolA-binding protein
VSGERTLEQLLGQLGRAQARERSREQELQRAEVLAARLDQQLAKLVAARRARRRRAVPLAAAATLLLGFGAWQLGRPHTAKLAIEREPLPDRAAQQLPALELPSPEPSARAVEPALPEPKPRALPSSSSQAEPAPSSSATVTSTLGDENRLFKEAAEATRSGDTDGALRHLDRLLHDYPSSPLAQTALVRKLRLLAKAGRSDAAQQAAKRYLELYPTGFATNEAQELLRGAPAAPSERP